MPCALLKRGLPPRAGTLVGAVQKAPQLHEQAQAIRRTGCRNEAWFYEVYDSLLCSRSKDFGQPEPVQLASCSQLNAL